MDNSQYDLPPGFGSADSADQHLGFEPFSPQAPQKAVGFGISNPLGMLDPSDMNPAIFWSLGGAILLGGIGGVLGAQRDMKTAAMAGGGAAVVGGVVGYFVPALYARMSHK